MSLYLGRIVPLVGGAQDKQPDGAKSGYLKVRYKGSVCWAAPCYAFGRFTPPSDAWLTKYAEKFGVWLMPELDTTGNEGAHIVYMGFKPFEDTLPQDVLDAFPAKQLVHAGADLEVVVNETAGATSVEVRVIDPDATAGTPAEKPVLITLDKATKKLTIALDVVAVGKKPTIVLEGVDADAKLTLGDGMKHAAVAEYLQTLWTQLQTYVGTLASVPGTAGGLLTTLPPGGTFPAWNTKIVSTHLAVPDET